MHNAATLHRHKPMTEPPLANSVRAERHDPGWVAEFWRRMKRHLLLKFMGISGFMWIFFIGYFHMLRHPVYPVTEMPLTALDRLITFQPGALIAYLTLWFYLGIAPSLLLSLRELVSYGLWVGGLCLVGLVCFYFWPTAVPVAVLGINSHPSFTVLQGVDAAGNACPSLHVATAMFSALWLDHLLRTLRAPTAARVFNGCWFIAIAYSTLAIKQHVVVDVIAGLVLGLAFALPSLRLRASFQGNAGPPPVSLLPEAGGSPQSGSPAGPHHQV